MIIATPDHWHAHITILACQAGKDVYVEKPLSQTIHEGQLMREAARKYNRVVQVGTQRRSSEHFTQRGRVRGIGQARQGLPDQGLDVPGARPASAIRPTARRPPASITTCGSDPRPSGRSTPTASTTTGASSGITATPSWATRASTCSTSRIGPSRTMRGVDNCLPTRDLRTVRHLLAGRRQGSSRHAGGHLRLRRLRCSPGSCAASPTTIPSKARRRAPGSTAPRPR